MILDRGFQERLTWLIRIRWIAAAFALAAVVATDWLSGHALPMGWLYGGVALIFISNVIHILCQMRFSTIASDKEAVYGHRLANVQIQVDFFLLTYLLFFTGGLENPFLFYFVFHAVIAGILLSERAAYMQAASAVLYGAFLMGGHRLLGLPHFHFTGLLPEAFCLEGGLYAMAVLAAFTSTLGFTVYMTTSIVKRLRAGEAQLAEAHEQLQAQDRIKSLYVATVSHDLQASLSAIQSCLNVVIQNLTGDLSDKAREMLCRAETRTRHLLVFVRDLLSLSKIRAADEFECQSVDAYSLVRSAIHRFQEDINAKQLHVSLGSIPSVLLKVNEELIMHVLMNLLSNAIRYTPIRGEICIKVKSIPAKKRVRFTLSDTGIGIPEAALMHVFEDFYRAPNAMILEKNGTGLGLAIVQQIVLGHGGEIWVESQLGKGASFYFTLPLS